LKYVAHIDETNTIFKKEQIDEQANPIRDNTIEVNRETYELIEIGYKFVEGSWVLPTLCDSPNILKLRIEELKEKLHKTDWIVLEVLEDQVADKVSKHDFDTIYKERQVWREEIHKLTELLNSNTE
jgi:FtsZ-binding cell division protein ZapB